jgi:hypothetical protein
LQKTRLGLREAIKLGKSQKARLLLLHVVDEYYTLAGGEAGSSQRDD